MDFNRLIARARNILLTPKTEWPVIAGESTSVAQLYTSYVLFLAAIPALMSFLKFSIIGMGVPFVGTIRVGVGAGLAQMVLQYGLALGLTFVLALIINALAPTFGGQKDQVQATKTAAYSYTAGWIASVCLVVPWIGWMLAMAGGIYGIYLMYLGLPHTMKAAPEKTGGYTAVVILLAIVLGWTGGAVVALVSGGMMGGMTGAYGANSSDNVTFSEDSNLGKLAAFGAKMEAASKDVEAAQQSGDADAQAKATAAMLGTAMGGGDSVEAIAPGALKALVPATLDGLPRTHFSASKNAAMGMQISTTRATYSDGQGRELSLEITDMGGAKGLMGMAAWASVEQENESDTGYDKTYNSDGRIIHEQWDNAAMRGEYSIVLGSRFMVKVEGEADGIDTLKAAVGSIDLGGLEAMKNQGVKSN